MTEPTDAALSSFEVTSDEAKLRLDKVLAQRFPERSRSAITRLVEEQRVFVNGEPASKPGLALKPGMVVRLELPEAPVVTDLVAEAMPLEIVWRDAHLAVINKPAGLVVHPAPGHATGTLVNGLLHWAQEEEVQLDIDDEVRPGLVHRIDKDTSGLLVIAFDDQTLRGLQAQFQVHSIERRYRAVVLGHHMSEEARIDTLYGRHPKDRKRFSGRVQQSPRRAITHWRVLSRGDALTLVECQLQTGRTHQIRVHLSEAGFPIVGDPLYGRETPRSCSTKGAQRAQLELRTARQMPRLALHAAVLGFEHPITGEKLRFEAPDPEDFAALVAALPSY